ncbi:MAG: glutamate dehydrogenase, partial [Actinomycetota bacterium]|nr:glutamate dehydrogenase [Actinomycetota bacterium]
MNPAATTSIDRTDDELEQRKAALVSAALAGAAKGDGARDDLGAYLSRYFQHVAADDILDWTADEVRGVALGQREFAATRPPGAPTVQVFTHGKHTTLEIVTDDMPFLVDSVTQELSRRDLAIQLLVHPQLVVRRDLNGRLLDVLATLDADEAPAGTIVESWMHIEVARQPNAEAEQLLRQDVVRVLRDVREAVEDWPRMRSLAERAAADLESAPPSSVPKDETAEVAEFLRWLAADHFTFLGYREYRLVIDQGEEALAVAAGTGLGVLRGDKPTPRPVSSLPAEVRSKLHDPQLLLVTKANSRSTVHRPIHLDYIGVKTFDSAGQVIGERRFLGLFTSVAYTESVARIPVLRRKAAEVLERSGFAPLSH